MASSDIKVRVLGDASSFQKSMRASGRAADGFGKSLAKVGKVAAVGFAGAIAGTTVVLKKSFDAAIDAEKAQTRLDSSFKAATVTAKQRATAMDAVSKVSRKAALDDEDLMDTLGKFTRITGDATEATKLMGVAADVARGRGISLEQATSIVTKAQLGQIGGLKRLGIEFPKVTAAQDALKASGVKATEEQKKAAKAADDTATRQAAIAALQKQYAGASEAYGKTAAGAQDAFRVAVENLEEKLGAKLLPTVTRLTQWAVANMPTFEKVATRAMDMASAAAEKLGPVLRKIGEGIVELARVAQAEWPKVQAAAAKVAAWYSSNLAPTMQSVLDRIKRGHESWANDSNSITARGMRLIGNTIKSHLGFWAGYFGAGLAIIRGDWGAAWDNLKSVVANRVGLIKGLITGLVGFISSIFSGAGKWLYAAGASILQGLWNGMKSKWDAVAGWLGGLGGKIVNLKGPPAQDKLLLTEAGNLIMQGLKSGMESGWQPLEAWLDGRSGVIVDKVRKLADAVRSAQGSYRSAWDDYTSQALAAFDDMASKLMTQSERLLAGLSKQTLKLDKKQAKRDVRDAGDNLAAASQTAVIARTGAATGAVSPEDLKKANDELFDAQMAYDRAVIAQQELTLGEKAAKERAAQDEQTANDRLKFAKWLETRTAQQQEMLIKEGKIQKSIVAKIKSYDKDYQATGVHLGEALVSGLEDMKGKVIDAAIDLQRAINAAMDIAGGGAGNKGKDTIDKTKNKKPPGFAKGVTNFAGGLALVGEKGPELVMLPPGSSVIPNAGNATTSRAMQAGSTVINAVFPGFIGNKDDLRQALNEIVRDQSRRNGGSAFAGMA